MTPSDAYSLLVEANPVPDPFGYFEDLAQGSPVIEPHELRRQAMQSIDIEPKTMDERAQRNRWIAIAIVALIAVLATVAIVIDRAPVADNPTDAELAIARTQDFLNARDATDLQTAAGSDFLVGSAVMTEWEWWSAFARAGYRGEVSPCRTTGGSPAISVVCSLNPADPVMLALGVDEMELEFQFFPDAGAAGQLKAPGYIDYRANGIAEAYGTYMSAYQPGIYAESCSPGAYETESILSSDGIAFTPECAQALIPYLDEIASWIDDGRPMP
ncbi:MAG: hypothetical protein WAN34_04265 [Acidimicrobiia bacterium]